MNPIHCNILHRSIHFKLNYRAFRRNCHKKVLKKAIIGLPVNTTPAMLKSPRGYRALEILRCSEKKIALLRFSTVFDTSFQYNVEATARSCLRRVDMEIQVSENIYVKKLRESVKGKTFGRVVELCGNG